MKKEEILYELKTSDINLEYICNSIYIEIINQIKKAFYECEKCVNIQININDYIKFISIKDIKNLRKKIKDKITKQLKDEGYIFNLKMSSNESCFDLEFYLLKMTKEQNKIISKYNKIISKTERYINLISNLFFVSILILFGYLFTFILDTNYTVFLKLGLFFILLMIDLLFFSHISDGFESKLNNLKSMRFDYFKSLKPEFYTKDNFDLKINSVLYGIKN